MTLFSRLAAYYPCDNTHGRSLSEDVFGTNDGTAGVVSAAAGKVRQGMFFLSSGEQFRSVPNAASLQGLKGLCCWVKFSTIAADQSIVSKGSDATDANTSLKLWFDQSAGAFAFTVGDSSSSTTVTTSGLTVAVDTWYHVRCFNDGNRMGIAVNGTLYASGAARAPLTETGLLYLGRDFGGNYFDGVLDEVALFSTAPTVADGAALYNGGSGASLPLLDSLPGPSGRAGAGTRWLPPSYAESDDAVAYMAHGKLPVQRFDGTLAKAGVEAPTSAPKLSAAGAGSMTGTVYAYTRFLDESGRVSSVSPLSDSLERLGSSAGAISWASNSSPIVITSTNHGLSTGSVVRVTGQQGNAGANGVWTVTRLTDNTFSLDGSVGTGDWSASAPPALRTSTTRTGTAGTNAVQSLSFTESPTGGSFTLSFQGESSSSISYDATASDIEDALFDVTAIGQGNVVVSGGPVNTTAVTIEFINNLATSDVPLIVPDYTGAAVTVSVVASLEGSPGVNEQQSVDILNSPSGGTFTLTFEGQTTSAIAYNAAASAVQSALEALSSVGTGNVSCTGGPLPGSAVTVEFIANLRQRDNDTLTGDVSSLTGGPSVSVSTVTQGASEKSVVFGPQDALPADVFVKSDGTRVFMVGSTDKKVYSYTLSTAYDLSTATYDDKSFSVSSQDSNPRGLHFSSDGLKVYILGGATDTVYQYTLSTAWDVSTASYASKSFSVASQDATPTGMSMSSDGTALFVTGDTNNAVYQYTLSTAWDVSTASYASKSLDVSSEDTGPRGISFNADGTTIYVSGSSTANDTIYQYSSPQPEYDLASGSDSGNRIFHGTRSSYNINFKSDGTTAYLAINRYSSGSGQYVVQYDLDSAWILQINATNGGQFSFDTEVAEVTGVGLRSVLFKSDGTKMYAAFSKVSNPGGIYQYSLSTPWDVTTASYDSKRLQASSNPGSSEAVGGAVFSSDGTKLYIAAYVPASSAADIYQYTLSTAWDVSTASYASKSFSVASQDSAALDVEFNDDGTRMFVLGGSDTVYQYTLSTAWDVSTASYASKSLVVNPNPGSFVNQGFCFGDSGTKLYSAIHESGYNGAYQYDMGATPWDLSVMTYDSKSLNVNANETSITCSFLSGDGESIYVAGTGSGTLYQYELSTAEDVSTGSYTSGSNEVQRVSETGSPSEGTFTLTFEGQTTSAIAYNAAASAVQSALEALSSVGTGNVSCTGGPLPGSAVDVEFTGSLSETNVSEIAAAGTGLLLSVTVVAAGVPPTDEIQKITVDKTPGTGTFSLTFNGQTTGPLQWNAEASEIESKLLNLSTIEEGEIACDGGPIDSSAVYVRFGGTLSKQNVSLITASSSLNMTSPSLNLVLSTAGDPPRNEVQSISVNSVTSGTFSLTFDGQTTSSLAFDATSEDVQESLETLSTVGSGNVLVSGGPLNQDSLRVEFVGDLGGADQSIITGSSANLLNGGWLSGANKITYTNVEVPTDLNVTRRQILRSKPGAANVFYIDVDEEDVTSNTFSSTKTDDELTSDLAVVMLDSNGVDTNLSRHGEPPNWKRSVASFQNRMFYGVDYVERSVVTISGDTATGVATDWPNVFDDRTLYQDSGKALAAFDANAQTAALSESTTTAQTAEKATIRQAAPDSQRIYHSWVNAVDSFPESVHPGQTFQISRDGRDGEMVGQFSFDGRFYVAFKSTIYLYSFDRDPTSAPDGDGRMQVVVPRGLCNHRTVAFTDDLAACMDHEGVYLFDGAALESVSGPIKSLFTGRSATKINWKHQEWFHAAYFSSERTIRFFVVLDGGPYPKHALCFNVDQRLWWLESYPWPITSSTTGNLNGRVQTFVGSTGRRIFTLDGVRDGLSPLVADTLRGTVDSAGSRTLSDTSATWTSSMVGQSLRIVSGTGRGQSRDIVAVSGTTLTLGQRWNVRPSTDSVYQIAGVDWSIRTGKLRFVQQNEQELRRVEVFWTPTVNSQSLDYRLFADFESVAVTNQETRSAAATDGVAVTAGSAYHEVDLTVRGHVEQDFGGLRPEGVSGEKFVELAAEGSTNDEAFRLLGIAVSGAE